LAGRSLEESTRFREPVTDGGDQTLMHTEVTCRGVGGVSGVVGIGVKWFGMCGKIFENSWERGSVAWRRHPAILRLAVLGGGRWLGWAGGPGLAGGTRIYGGWTRMDADGFLLFEEGEKEDIGLVWQRRTFGHGTKFMVARVVSCLSSPERFLNCVVPKLWKRWRVL
jgi:hypothetical protein